MSQFAKQIPEIATQLRNVKHWLLIICELRYSSFYSKKISLHINNSINQ